MFAAARRAITTGSFSRAFSTTSSRADLSKLVLIGRLGKAPELRTTKSDKEYVSYTIATTNPPPAANPDGTRPESTTSWHTVVSFNPNVNNFLRTLQKGTQVYAEAAYELREPNHDAEPDSPAAQRQVYLRHETLRIIRRPQNDSRNDSSDY